MKQKLLTILLCLTFSSGLQANGTEKSVHRAILGILDNKNTTNNLAIIKSAQLNLIPAKKINEWSKKVTLVKDFAYNKKQDCKKQITIMQKWKRWLDYSKKVAGIITASGGGLAYVIGKVCSVPNTCSVETQITGYSVSALIPLCAIIGYKHLSNSSNKLESKIDTLIKKYNGIAQHHTSLQNLETFLKDHPKLITCQNFIRGYLNRKAFNKKIQASIVLQSWLRGILQRGDHLVIRRKNLLNNLEQKKNYFS